jgi:AcrR family transcriptional regulator
MARTDARGGPETRARIAEVASGLFFERGFDAVTVAEIARAAGVSAVTVHKHFPRKEDLFLDRSAEAVDRVRSAVLDRPTGEPVLDALERFAVTVLDERSALAGVDPRSAPFLATVAGSPSLRSRARELVAELRAALADAIGDDDPTGLLAALFLAGYETVYLGSASRVMAGKSPEAIVAAHRAGLDTLFATLRDGLPR